MRIKVTEFYDVNLAAQVERTKNSMPKSEHKKYIPLYRAFQNGDFAKCKRLLNKTKKDGSHVINIENFNLDFFSGIMGCVYIPRDGMKVVKKERNIKF